MQDIYLSIREAARELNISDKTVARYIEAEKITAYRYSSRKTLISLAEIRAFRSRTITKEKKDRTNATLADKCEPLD